jgi:hypothetical protein
VTPSKRQLRVEADASLLYARFTRLNAKDVRRRRDVSKQFKLSPEQIQPIAHGYGSCIASDRITVDGLPVGYMYRESPDNDTDSGWRFFAGDVDDAYANDPAHFALYDVNTIANYDRSIVEYLDAPLNSAFGRDHTGRFASELFEPS